MKTYFVKTMQLGVLLAVIGGLCGCTTLPGVPKETVQQVEAAEKLLKAGRNPEALFKLRKIAERTPDNPYVLALIASTLADARLYTQAISFAERTAEIPPKSKTSLDVFQDRMLDSEMYVLIGDAYYKLKRIEKAAQAYEKAISLNSSNSRAYNNWGYMYADFGVHIEEALRLTKHAVALEPKNGCYLDSLGWAYFRNGEYQKAVKYLEEAIARYPSDADCRYHLGKAYESVGAISQALVEYNKALFLNPMHKDAKLRIRAIRIGNLYRSSDKIF